MDLWLEIVIGAISGGLAGTIVTLYFERRQRRQATAVTLVQVKHEPSPEIRFAYPPPAVQQYHLALILACQGLI